MEQDTEEERMNQHLDSSKNRTENKHVKMGYSNTLHFRLVPSLPRTASSR